MRVTGTKYTTLGALTEFFERTCYFLSCKLFSGLPPLNRSVKIKERHYVKKVQKLLSIEVAVFLKKRGHVAKIGGHYHFFRLQSLW